MEQNFQDCRSLSHSEWDCKYHQIPYGVYTQKETESPVWQSRRHLGEIFHALARQKECQILEGHLLP